MKAKVRKFIRSSWMKLLQQVVIMGLALSLAGCAAVQNPSSLGNPAAVIGVQVSVIQISGAEMMANLDADEAYLLAKPGASSYIFSYLKQDAGRAFVFISNGNVLPRGLLIGINRTADAMTTFLRDGYNLVPAAALPSLLAKLPMPSILLIPATNLDMTPITGYDSGQY